MRQSGVRPQDSKIALGAGIDARIQGAHNLILFLKMSSYEPDDFFLEGGDELEGICF